MNPIDIAIQLEKQAHERARTMKKGESYLNLERRAAITIRGFLKQEIESNALSQAKAMIRALNKDVIYLRNTCYALLAFIIVLMFTLLAVLTI